MASCYILSQPKGRPDDAKQSLADQSKYEEDRLELANKGLFTDSTCFNMITAGQA